MGELLKGFFLVEINAMKRLLICAGLIAAAATLSAQMDMGQLKSPPATETTVIGGKAITISYNSPGVKGRAGHIFTKNGLISHDPTYPVWRAGANTATKLHTEADLDLGGLIVPKGDYTLYVDISNPAQWVLIVNKQTGQWGTLYDKAEDGKAAGAGGKFEVHNQGFGRRQGGTLAGLGECMRLCAD
jgi:hypothetical protein